MRSLVVVTVSALVLAAQAGCSQQRSSLFVQGEPTGSLSCEHRGENTKPLKVANYNIKSGMWSSLDEVGDVLEGLNADVIALEEVDNGMGRTGHVDQSAVLAERLHAEIGRAHV